MTCIPKIKENCKDRNLTFENYLEFKKINALENISVALKNLYDDLDGASISKILRELK